MLQPLQLKDVSVRYANEIAELQDFFQKAGCLPEANALHAVALRLMQDRAFHRDLTSHLWVVIHPHHQNISYADLLGILAIAAAGIQAAAEADEDDAHGLLGFLMEARESLDALRSHPGTHAAPPTPLTAAASPATPPRPLQSAAVPEPAILHSRTSLLSASATPSAEQTTGSRKRLLWIGALVFAALATGLELHHLAGPARTTPVPAASVSSGTASSGAVATGTLVPAQPSTPIPETPTSIPREAPPGPSASPTERAARETHSVSPPRSAHPPLAVEPSVAASPAAAPSAVPAATTPSPAPHVSAPLLSHAAPTSAVSHAAPPPVARNAPPAAGTVHLNATPAYTDSSTPNPGNLVRQRAIPHLLRRTPQEKAEILAAAGANLPSSLMPTPTPVVPHGTVRAESVGAYAANVIYQPIPEYPHAAYAAHVQGEVKLESEVDRNGNVASVRVVSGPPLLRDAALDAAQRWRYRPNTAGSQQIPMNTLTVFVFHLP